MLLHKGKAFCIHTELQKLGAHFVNIYQARNIFLETKGGLTF